MKLAVTDSPAPFVGTETSLIVRLLPGLTCLIYPVLVWSISAWSPYMLPLTMIPPIVSMACIFRMSPQNRYPRAVAVAHLGVAAPALYNLIGAVLDFQEGIPFHGNAAWIVLWIGLLTLVAFEKPAPASSGHVHSQSRLKTAHGIAAAVVVLFALFHLTNHLAGLAGGEAHLALMKAFRTVYRSAIIEPLLGTAVVFQVLSGFVLLRRRLMTPDRFEMVQGAAGAYLLVFFVPHLRAVLRARYVRHIDTNWIWLTSSNLLTDEWSARLVPYYFLGILALGVHGACGLRYVLRQHGRDTAATAAFWTFSVASVVVALAIMTGLIAGSMHQPPAI